MTGTDKWTLLILEDNRGTITFLEYALAKLGYDWIVADSREEALEELEQRWVDGIIMDVNLGNRNSGPQFLHEIRKKEKLSNIPAIAIAAHTRRQDRKRLLLEGFDGCLATPFKSSSLRKLLERHVLNAQAGPDNRLQHHLDRLFSEVVQTLKGRLTNGQYPDIEQFGRNLKGTSGNLELRNLGKIGAQMTLAAGIQDNDKLDRYIKEFEQLALQKTEKHVGN